MTTFTFADLFAGVGGMRLAFEKAGGRCVLTSEWDKHARQTYLANWSDSDEHHKWVFDVRHIQKSDIPTKRHALDVLVAGFPCQPYSIAGLRKGLKDDRGGDIFTALLRILSEVKPKAFLLENVKGIMGHDDGQTFAYMQSQLEACGYHLAHAVLNSMSHAGIPQNRERVFIIGFRDASKFKKFVFPQPMNLTTTIEECLQSGKIPAEFYYDERFKIFDQLRNEVNGKDTLYQWRRKYVRANKSHVCPTLTANMGSGGHNVPLLRDKIGIRKLTPRETFNFQGFPPEFELPVDMSNNHLYHQAGNSVTVPLITKLAVNIASVL